MHNDDAYLIDILDSARIAVKYLENISFNDFETDIKTQDAVIRRLEMIGEASFRVSLQTQNNYRDLPWTKMKSMRNFLIHEYDDIDFKIVWETVKNNIPPLISEQEKIVI